MAEDLLGGTLTEAESALLGVYTDLKQLLQRDDLPPCAEANVRAATAAMWNVVNDLALDYEHLSDLGL